MTTKPPKRITDAVEQLSRALVHATTAMNLNDDDMTPDALVDARYYAARAVANLGEQIETLTMRKFTTKTTKARKPRK